MQIDPITFPKETFNLAYLAEDARQHHGNSFTLLLTKTNGQHKTPKMIKFAKDDFKEQRWTIEQ